MNMIHFIFHMYAFIGLLMIIFSSFISHYLYNLVLVYTNRMDLKDAFLFRVNRKNRDSMFSVARYFTITVGLTIIFTSLYYISRFDLSLFW